MQILWLVMYGLILFVGNMFNRPAEDTTNFIVFSGVLVILWALEWKKKD